MTRKDKNVRARKGSTKYHIRHSFQPASRYHEGSSTPLCFLWVTLFREALVYCIRFEKAFFVYTTFSAPPQRREVFLHGNSGPKGTKGDQRGPKGTKGDQRGPKLTKADQRGRSRRQIQQETDAGGRGRRRQRQEAEADSAGGSGRRQRQQGAERLSRIWPC